MGLMRVISRSVAYRSMAFNKEKGCMFLWGMPYFLITNDALAFFQKKMTETFGNIIPDMLFFLGKKHGYNATKVLIKKYGILFAGDYKFFVEQGDLVGVGSVILDETDETKKKHHTKNITSPLSEAYLKIFGKQKSGVDHYLRGLASGVSMALNGWDNLTIEDKCIARGDKECSMITADKSYFKGNEKFYSDLPKEIKELEEIFKKINFDSIFEFSKAEGDSKLFKFDNGKLSVDGSEGMFTAIYIWIILDKILYEKYKDKYLSKIYESGEFQGKSLAQTSKISKKVVSMVELDNLLKKIYSLGFGNFTVSKNIMDKKSIYIENYESPFARQYFKIFGQENRAVDNYACGILNGFVSEIMGKKTKTIESSCLMKNKTKCVFKIEFL